MTKDAENAAAGADAGATPASGLRRNSAGQPAERTVRNLKILVIVLGVLLIAGLIAVIARIMYLAMQPSAQHPASVAPGTTVPQLELPVGANIRSMSLSGNQLAVHYEAPRGVGIAIIDLASGRTVTHIDVTTQSPRD